jgi:hypothetical protein
MADILADPVEICFGSFTASSTSQAAATSLAASVEALVTLNVVPSSGEKSKTHPPNHTTLFKEWSASST